VDRDCGLVFKFTMVMRDWSFYGVLIFIWHGALVFNKLCLDR
jgi:hypothetical protein